MLTAVHCEEEYTLCYYVQCTVYLKANTELELDTSTDLMTLSLVHAILTVS
jgi:hypothetical protein